MKIFFKKNPYRSLEKRLGYTFRKKDLLANALMHRSYRYESADIRGRSLRGSLDRGEFTAHTGQRGVETGDFLFDQTRRNDQVRHLERGLRDEVRLPDGNPPRYRQTVQSEAHGMPTLLHRTCPRSV